MKKLLSLFILVSVIRLSAQTYHPFPVSADSAAWTFETTIDYVWPIPTSVTETSDQFSVAGDTIIGGGLYYKMYHSYGPYHPLAASGFNYSTAQYYGAVREDSTKKVWISYSNDTLPPSLLYDFSLTVGDTFCFPEQGVGPNCVPVGLVDSVLVNGGYRKQWHFYSGGMEDIWIEGIGSIKTMFNVVLWSYIGNFYVNLNCFTELHANFYGVCNYYVSGTGIHENTSGTSGVKLFPNPALAELCIELEKNTGGNFSVAVYSVLGEEVISYTATDHTFKMDISSLKTGAYFIKVRDENGNASNGKFIKAAM